MSIIIPANSAAAGLGYQVTNSLRFDESDDCLIKTFGSAGNRKLWTYSVWFKRGKVGTSVALFVAGASGGNDEGTIRIEGDKIDWQNYDVSDNATDSQLLTLQLIRDPSAWYHLVCSWDSANSTAGNRMRMYLNGTEITSFATDNNPTLNYDTATNNAVLHNIGRQSWNSASDYSGYMAEICFIDGAALTPTSFGEFDGDSGIWKPKDDLAGDLTFGNNGFYLEFKQSGTGTDASGMGADTSGEGNHWAVNNLTAINQTTDSCTNNFATLNPIDNGYGAIDFTEGNTQAQGSSSGWQPARATMGVSSGKWYWEVNMSGSNQIGVSNETIDMDNDNAQDLVGVTVFYNASGGIIRTNGSQVGGTTATFVLSDVAGYALDMDNKKLSIYKNGSIIVTNTALSTSITDFALPFFSVNGGGEWKVNFGNPSVALDNAGVADGNGYGAFEYTPPSGYLALCTANLSEELS